VHFVPIFFISCRVCIFSIISSPSSFHSLHHQEPLPRFPSPSHQLIPTLRHKPSPCSTSTISHLHATSTCIQKIKQTHTHTTTTIFISSSLRFFPIIFISQQIQTEKQREEEKGECRWRQQRHR